MSDVRTRAKTGSGADMLLWHKQDDEPIVTIEEQYMAEDNIIERRRMSERIVSLPNDLNKPYS